MSLSSTERQLYSNVSGIAMALDQLCRTLGDHLPATKSQVDSICSMMSQQFQDAERNCTADLLVGNGPIATTRRRANTPLVKLEIEIGLPKAYLTQDEMFKSDIRKSLIEAARYYLGSRSVTSDDHYFWDIEKLLPNEDAARKGHFSRFTPSLDVNNSGIYSTETGSSWRPEKGWVLAIDVKIPFENHSVVLLHQNGQVDINTYVAIEKQWVRHSDLRYVHVGQWMSELQRCVALWGLIPVEMPCEEMVRATLEGLVQDRAIQSGPETRPEDSRSHYPDQHKEHPTMTAQYVDKSTPEEVPTNRQRVFCVNEGKGRLSISWSHDLTVEGSPVRNFTFYGHWYGFGSCRDWNNLPIPLRRDVINQMVSGMSILGTDPAESVTEHDVSNSTGTVVED